MKDINRYIIEKLHLNKDIEVANDKELKKDDEFFCISADIMFGEINIKLYNPMTFKKITEKKITYITDAGKTLTKEYFINSNGFYEMKPNGSFTAIAMTVDYGIELLEKILKSEEVDKNFLYKYFDKEDEWIDDYSIKKDYTNDTVRKIINSLKTEDYVSEKLHLNKDIKINEINWFQIDIADEIYMPNWAYEYRKLKNGSENRLWYAVYCYLYKNGPAKVKDILDALDKSGKSYEGRFMSELRNYGVIRAGSGKDRGLQFPEDPSNWSNFVGNSYIC